MYQISQLMSTPVPNKCSFRSDREHVGEPSPECVFSRFACDSLDGDGSFECYSTDPLTGCYHACRRSPRLLTNGYYIWTEDSFLCDSDGNISLHPSHTSVMYKENLVRVFRKKKRIRHSLSSFFNPRASKSWLAGSIFNDMNSSASEEIWQENVRRPSTYHHHENGDTLDYPLADEWELEKLVAESVEASSSSHLVSQPLREISQDTPLQSLRRASEHFQENILDHSKPNLFRETSFHAVLLTLCFIISACARWFLGGVLANVFICASMITTAYIVQSLLFSIGSYFKGPTYARLDVPKCETHEDCC
ncbi:transmembrane protein 71 isoform X2 [Perognathus longimembris pacificus]|uniref:transmembrane protein 71 isoform X2 n=1 Tax=Perognathus longimembris pacificus TaxID=214514 RepID=UPI002019BE17|nr:transmembrane protein 71 isoform X2 [Perognathus longimembris pacificus]